MKYLHPIAGFVIFLVVFNISQSSPSKNSKLLGTTNNKLKEWQIIWMNVMATPEILSTVILVPGLILRSSKRKEQKYHKYCWHKITRRSAERYWGQSYRQTHKQYSVQVICCISGRRVVHMTLTATQNTGNYRNSQATGKAFIHSGFTATIHLHWVRIVSDVTLGVPVKHWLTPQKITVCWGRYQGMNLPLR